MNAYDENVTRRAATSFDKVVVNAWVERIMKESGPPRRNLYLLAEKSIQSNEAALLRFQPSSS